MFYWLCLLNSLPNVGESGANVFVMILLFGSRIPRMSGKLQIICSDRGFGYAVIMKPKQEEVGGGG